MNNEQKSYINYLKYWISQVQVDYRLAVEYSYHTESNELEWEYFCPFCHNTSTMESNLYHDEGCPLGGDYEAQ